jgi:hypothetical protein
MGRRLSSDGAIVALRHKGRTVDRLDSERARWTPLADLPRRAWGVAALANGTVIAAGDTEGWLLRPGRRMKEIALPPPSRRSLRGLPEVPPHSRLMRLSSNGDSAASPPVWARCWRPPAALASFPCG